MFVRPDKIHPSFHSSRYKPWSISAFPDIKISPQYQFPIKIPISDYSSCNSGVSVSLHPSNFLMLVLSNGDLKIPPDIFGATLAIMGKFLFGVLI